MSDPVRPEDVEALLAQFRASDLTELHLRTDGFELFVSHDTSAPAPWDGVATSPAPAATAAAAAVSKPGTPAAPAPAPAALPEGMAVVRAPYLGHFYRAPKPGEPHFCEIGDTVAAGDDLCLVEVMKLFTAVRADVAGIVRHILAVDGEMVEEGQPLFAIEPVA